VPSSALVVALSRDGLYSVGQDCGSGRLEPTVDNVERTSIVPARRKRGSRVWTWVKRAVLAVIVIGALPAVLTLVYLPHAVHPVSTLMMKDIVTLQGYDRDWTPLEEIGDNVVHSVMMSEDGQFCSHRGIDLGEFRAVLEDFWAGEATRGGSTITMQTVKNLYLWHGRSYVRKAIELPYAIYLDLVMPKRRIMEIYLNIAEWGPGIYGAEAAALHHFGKSTRDLSARQAALLAVTLPSPLTRTPGQPSAGLNRLAATIERRARGAGGYNHCLPAPG
jgi:monofunctional biosynthetic peptidoglycan transglycosylase